MQAKQLSLFDTPQPAATNVPTVNENPSQKDLILDYLNKGYGLTPLQALDKFKCMRLAAVIHILKKEGHNIVTENTVKNKKKFATYRLIKPIQ